MNTKSSRNPNAIRCYALGRTYRSTSRAFPILVDVNFDVSPGEIVSIRGSSGSGKTTLLHLIATIDRPDLGQVFIQGNDVTRLNSDTLCGLRRKHLGVIYQEPCLISRYKVWQNVSLPLIPEGLGEAHLRDSAARCLERLRLLDKLDEHPNRLSGGERQRVGIARALVGAPEIIIADEPTSQVDPETQGIISELFVGLRQEGRALVIASHEPELWKIADRSFVLDQGRLTEES